MPRSVTTAMVVIAYLHDGTSIYDQMFLEHLAENHTVHFLTFCQKPRFVPKKTSVTIMHDPLPACITKHKWTEGIRMYTLFLLRALTIRLHLKRLKPDVVIGCMATKYGFYATFARSKPTIVIVWGTDVLIAPKRFIFFRFLATHTLRKADAVILDSDIQKNTTIQLGCKSDKILEFPWFNTKDIIPKRNRSQVRYELGWQSNIIVHCARSHEPIYRVQDLIEAIPQIMQKHPDTRFLILGKGSLTPMLKQKAKELGIGQYARFLGAVSRQEAIDYLNGSDIYVSTSLSDGTSASLLEAMTLGILAVVTNIPGNREWIRSNFNGILTPTRDPETLAQNIVQLVEHKEATKKMARNAQETAKQKVDWQRNMLDFDNLIRKLGKRNPSEK